MSLYSVPLMRAFDGSLFAPLVAGAAFAYLAVAVLLFGFVLPELRGAAHGEVCGGGAAANRALV